jgi:hypothetical protein
LGSELRGAAMLGLLECLRALHQPEAALAEACACIERECVCV